MSGERVLVVDDNPVNLKLAQLTLRVEGYQVRAAADAEEAVGILREFTPHLILMDVQLPGIDGLELTRRLKAGQETRGIVVVALTAYAMKGDEERMLAAGCDGYIAKPIDTKTLPPRVAGYIAQSENSPSR